MSDSANAQKLAEDFAQACNSGNLAAFEPLFHPEFRCHIGMTEPGIAELQSTARSAKQKDETSTESISELPSAAEAGPL